MILIKIDECLVGHVYMFDKNKIICNWSYHKVQRNVIASERKWNVNPVIPEHVFASVINGNLLNLSWLEDTQDDDAFRLYWQWTKEKHFLLGLKHHRILQSCSDIIQLLKIII